jgi:hypothetical protein
MNENAVAPPYGMWNRISSELGSEALPVVAAPASAIPGRAMVGFFAGALILGATFVTAYLVNRTNVVTQQIQKEAPSKAIPAKEIPASGIAVVEKSAEPAVAMQNQKPVPVSISNTAAVSQIVVAQQVEEKAPVVESYAISSDVSVPDFTREQSTAASAEPYYFPPVDINELQVKGQLTAEGKTEKPDEEDKLEERKIRTSSSGEKRLKFKKKRSSSFSYGRLNRLKNPK